MHLFLMLITLYLTYLYLINIMPMYAVYVCTEYYNKRQ